MTATIKTMLSELRKERQRIDHVIKALERLTVPSRRIRTTKIDKSKTLKKRRSTASDR